MTKASFIRDYEKTIVSSKISNFQSFQGDFSPSCWQNLIFKVVIICQYLKENIIYDYNPNLSPEVLAIIQFNLVAILTNCEIVPTLVASLIFQCWDEFV